MLKKISVIRMEVGSAPIQDGPASPARDPGHAANRVDDAGMTDRFQRRQVAGAVAIHEAGAKVEPLLGSEPNARQIGLVAPEGIEGERRNVPKQDPDAAQEILRSHQPPAPEQPEIGVLDGGAWHDRIIKVEECRDACSHDESGFYERCRWVSTR